MKLFGNLKDASTKKSPLIWVWNKKDIRHLEWLHRRSIYLLVVIAFLVTGIFSIIFNKLLSRSKQIHFYPSKTQLE